MITPVTARSSDLEVRRRHARTRCRKAPAIPRPWCCLSGRHDHRHLRPRPTRSSAVEERRGSIARNGRSVVTAGGADRVFGHSEISSCSRGWQRLSSPGGSAGVVHRVQPTPAPAKETDVPAGPFGWTHGDLQYRNLLRDSGRLVAILDWERLGVRPYGEKRSHGPRRSSSAWAQSST
ncbi:phosphotransferase [Streptomyces echinatus]|uniref:phosphotransferase n=1 Tax=Streptomyces echinatus TaxID=67293 RepID=UPI00381A5B85